MSIVRLNRLKYNSHFGTLMRIITLPADKTSTVVSNQEHFESLKSLERCFNFNNLENENLNLAWSLSLRYVQKCLSDLHHTRDKPL